jgi:3-oxoacid CoA-transferase subunit A
MWPDAATALREVVSDGMTIAVGGFGLSGNPTDLIEALRDSGANDLTIVSNNMGVDGKGLGILLENKQVRKVLASYVGENKLFASQYLDGTVEVEFVPQGTLAERLRAGGAGIPAFYTATGVGTPVAEGKPLAEFDGRSYVQERGIVADLALVHAYQADAAGNLVYRWTARNFNPLVATAGRITIVEAEHILDGEHIDPDLVITPGVYVQRLVQATDRVKEIEQRTVTPRVADTSSPAAGASAPDDATPAASVATASVPAASEKA